MSESVASRGRVRRFLPSLVLGGCLLATLGFAPASSDSPIVATSQHTAMSPNRYDQQSGASDSVLIHRYATLPVDSSLLLLASVIAEGENERHQSVWAGYEPLRYPAFLVREGASLVISPEAPGPGLQQIDSSFLPSEVADRFYLFYGNIDDYHGRVPAVWRLRDYDLFTVLWIFYHEQFHAFQGRSFAGFRARLDTYFRSRYDPMAPEWYAKAEVELRILRDAIATESRDSVATLLRSYLSVRDARLRDAPEVAASERFSEWHEGVADLVGIRAAALALHADSADKVVVARLRERLPVGRGRQVYISSGRFYGTGAAQAYLLDRLGIAWRYRVQSGDYLDALLAEAIGYVPEEVASVVAHALSVYGYQELVQTFARP